MQPIKYFIYTILIMSGTMAHASPRVETRQEISCRGVMAYTTPSDNGEYILMTALEVVVGGPAITQTYYFLDESKYGLNIFLPGTSSEAGCEDCMPNSKKVIFSDHFWQEASYVPFTEYCPMAGDFGTWDGSFCTSLSNTNPGCTIM
ncbi:hypothetical protein [Pseudomonas cichorii]|uniref:hypothetical protein n=1 Tax=Pseudomonas cichorii TaxID=36746 RepID=UPI001C8A61A5|nr:hypothetical protein [Pseudomonas cichorii]MBX8573470.1 hypothetical protein [Pseudomonas cichorii]